MERTARSLSATRVQKPAPFFAGVALAAIATLHGPPASADRDRGAEARVSEARIALAVPGAAPGLPPLALCTVRVVESAGDLALLCRHELGSWGEVSLVRAGSGARSEPPFWTAPLASPFDAVAPLSDAARAALDAGELVLRIETGAAGIVVEGSIPELIFPSGFEFFSLCEWSNFPCPSDDNVCTSEVCNPTGVCSHLSNTESCSLPNTAVAACSDGSCQVDVCEDFYSHCDLNQANGCEVNHDSVSGFCGEGVGNVGNYGGDLLCGNACIFLPQPTVFATRTGRTEAWYWAQLMENTQLANCSAPLRHVLDLDVPEGVNYNIEVYRPCGTLVAFAMSGGFGEDEQVVIEGEDLIGSNDGFLYWVKVAHVAGSSCSEWSLSFTGFACP
jgi:hypothetical protein